MAYSGFFAAEDLYEVAKHGDPSDGTWMLPVDKADEYPDDVFVTRTDEVTGRPERVRPPEGQLRVPPVGAGPAAQRQLLHARGADPLRGAPRAGRAAGPRRLRPDPAARPSITEAVELLDLTICEPALGSGAFLNEAINQLAAEYLRRRQAELGETLDPERYNRELQKVKAHFALHQSYGVDLNATAVELAEVSLWLNCHVPRAEGAVVRPAAAPGQQPDRLPAGHVAGRHRRAAGRGRRPRPARCYRRSTGRSPRRSDDDEIHHFLLPGHGWAAVADRKEANELRPDEIKALKAWRKAVLAGPQVRPTAPRLVALARGVENLWAAAGRADRADPEGAAAADRRVRRSCWRAGDSREPGRCAAGVDRSRLGAGPAADADGRLGRAVVLAARHRRSAADVGRVAGRGRGSRAARRAGRYTGQLDLFDDLAGLLDAEREQSAGMVTVAQLREAHPWLGVALDAARREGAWHWELELRPCSGAAGSICRWGTRRGCGRGGWKIWCSPSTTRGGASPRSRRPGPSLIAGRWT